MINVIVTIVVISLLAFTILGGWTGFGSNYGYRQWSARELALHGFMAAECIQFENIDVGHTLKDPECVCYCPPDARMVKIEWNGNMASCNCPKWEK